MRRVVFGTLAALALAAPAQAAPSLVSATADGVPVAVSVDEHLGVGTASFQVPPGTGLNATAVYEIVVDTGAWQAREARVTGRGVSVAINGTRATIRLRPVGTSWNPALTGCTVSGGCGDATTARDQDLSGRAEGVLSDLRTAVPPGGAAVQAGLWQASNAQFVAPAVFDTATRAFTARLGNPHLRPSGAPATGAYEVFLPERRAALVPGDHGRRGRLGQPGRHPHRGHAHHAGRRTRPDAHRRRRRAAHRGHRLLARDLPGLWRGPGAAGQGAVGEGAPPSAARVRLSWKAPARSGAMPVTTYRVRCGTGAATVRTRSVIIRARAGVTCTIRPHSAAGYGPAVLKRV